MTKLLIETCLDNRVLASKRRRVGFNVQADSFAILETGELFVDLDLLEQAFNNIMDNAFKYSYRNTTIQVTGASAGAFFCLVISNEGVTLAEKDVGRVRERGWRAEEAESVVGEGSGIGLWVVDHIMKAHSGRLEILPTNRGRTEVRLLFPWK
jgi:signal transduction histidine kinase